MTAKNKVLSNRTVRRAAVLLTGIIVLWMHGIAAAQAEISAWQALQTAINQAENGSVISLNEDVTALPEDSRLKIASGKCVTLDLNGHTLNRNLPEYRANNGSVLYVQKDAILTIRNSGDQEGVITGGYHDNGGGILNDGTLILKGGSVTDNTSLGYGCGVYNQAKAHLTVYGGIVFGNSASSHQEIVNEGMLSIVSNPPDGEAQEDMPILKNYIVQITVFPAVATLLALLLAVRLDTYLSRTRKRSMTVIIALVFGVILQNCLEYRLTLLQGNNAFRVLLSVFGYVARPVILAMFLSVVKPSGRCRTAWALVGINGGIYLTAFFSPPDLLVHGERSFQRRPAQTYLYHCQRSFVHLALYPDHAAVSSPEKKRILAAHSGNAADCRRCGHGFYRNLRRTAPFVPDHGDRDQLLILLYLAASAVCS